MRRLWNDAASATSDSGRPSGNKTHDAFKDEKSPGRGLGNTTVHDDSFTHPLDAFEMLVVEFSHGLKLSASLGAYLPTPRSEVCN